MGHGLQRSYLLALLQELAGSEADNAPTLILGCEEPELYQHPPQARHLAQVFCELATANNQILVTTHSPLFVSGEGFEDVRLVRRAAGARASSTVSSLTFQSLCDRIRQATGADPLRRLEGLVAKIHQALQPGIAEMFFTRIPVLVEGLEDVSYLTTQLQLSGLWPEFRRLGCHIIPVNGKDKLIQPLAISAELGLPSFVVFDADGDTVRPEHRVKHERDNQALMTLLGSPHPPFPAGNVTGDNFTVWESNLTNTVKADFPEADYMRITNATRLNYAQEGGLEKNHMFVAEWLSTAHSENLQSGSLNALCQSIIEHARNEA
jgi:predicted ATP-dependent endonuclease of OLD family